MERLVWMRVPGDIVFAAGGVFLALFAIRLWAGTRAAERAAPSGGATASAPAG